MHDFITMSKLSDSQLQDMLQSIERKLGCPMNSAAFELMYSQKELIIMVLQERRMAESLKNPPLPSMSLTVDELSEKEKYDEEKNRQQKDY